MAITNVRASLAALLALAAATAAPAVARASPDTDFLAAKAAYERGDRGRLEALAPSLQAHVLEPYLAWWRLKLAIDTTDPAAIRAYAAGHAGSPLADRALAEGLRAAGRRGDWAGFRALYGNGGWDDVEILCYAHQAARSRDGESALAAAKPLWFSGQATPEACEPLFAALVANGSITLDDRWTRYRLALEAGNVRLAQQVAESLPAAERIDPRDFRRVEAKPAAELAQGAFRWKHRDGRELALYALDRAARADATAARVAWLKWRDRCTDAERRWGNGRLAYHASRQLLPWAIDAWREPVPEALSADAHAWRVRAALRAQAWRDVLAAIDAMPATIASESAWRFWRARALVESGRADEGRALLRAIARDPEYHGLLAADRLGLCVDRENAPAVPDPAWQAAFRARPGVARAIKLAELDLRADSQREWLAVVRDLDDAGLLQASMVAAAHSMHDRAINTAIRTREHHDYALRYPMPFRERFAAAAREHAIDEWALFGIARQESRFVPQIVSSAGAMGLMQLMPSTARLVAQQTGRTDYRPSRIADNEINTLFGAYYFKYWLDRLDASLPLALAAYNAGPGRAQSWRPPAPLDAAIWVETIPFNETRDYVKKVLANMVWYARELGDPAATLAERSGVIGPRPATSAATLADRG